MLPFVLGVFPAIDADLYLVLQSKCSKPVDLTKNFATLEKHLKFEAPATNKTKFFYYINKLTSIHCLCISFFVVSNVLTIAYGKGHSGFD